jgi:hypothetical protein
MSGWLRLFEHWGGRDEGLAGTGCHKNNHRRYMLAFIVGAVLGLVVGYTVNKPPLASLSMWLEYRPGEAILWTMMGAAVVGGGVLSWWLLSDLKHDERGQVS